MYGGEAWREGHIPGRGVTAGRLQTPPSEKRG